MLGKLSNKLLDVTSRNLNNLCTTFDGLGIVINGLTQSQLSYIAINECNRYVKYNPYYEICMYSTQKELPITITHFAVYNTLDLVNSEGHLLVTDPVTWLAAQSTKQPKLYYYIYDATIIKFLPKQDIEIIKSSNTIMFSRTKEHNRWLKKNFGLNIIDRAVPEFNLDQITSIIKEHS